MIININTDEVVVFTNKLHALSRSALPQAIRNTLNGTALDVKKNTMPKEAAKEFTQRKPSFFKAKSRVDFARGSDIRLMESTVGFIGDDQAVKDLEQQEYGGDIEGRSFIAMDTARGGASHDKMVKPANRLSNIKNILNSNTMEGRTPKAQFIHAANKAGVGGFVIGNQKKKILYRVDAIGGDYSGSVGKSVVKLTPIYSFEPDRSVQVDGTGFMRTASTESGEEMNKRFIQEAEKIIERFYK